MNERIRIIRKTIGISQTEFGRRIGVSLGVIKNLEQGKTTLTSPLFELLCSIYNVNPDWLHTGDGEIFLPNNDSPLDELQKQYNLSDDAMKVIKGVIQMPPDEQDYIIRAMTAILNS